MIYILYCRLAAHAALKNRLLRSYCNVPGILVRF